VADSPPAVYQYNPTAHAFTLLGSMVLPSSNGQVWSARGVSANEQHSLDIAMSNRDGPSQLFAGFTPRLTPALVPVGAQKASSAALGDVDGDGRVDLVLGAAPPPNLSSFAYINRDGTFTTSSSVEFLSTGFGPHQVALGDMNGDGKLDAAIGTPVALQIYTDMSDITHLWSTTTNDSVHSLAWSDANDE